MARTDIPRLLSCFSSLIIRSEVDESRPLVGSSSSNKEGFVINSYPIDILFLSPPETPLRSHPPTIVSAHDYKESLLITLSTLLSISSPLSPILIWHANLNNSLAVIVISKISSCWTKADVFPNPPFRMRRLLTLTSPCQ